MQVEIEELLRYPMESDDWIITMAIGGIAVLFSIFIFPAIVVAGYFVRALRAGIDGATEPPVFDDWGTLLKEGFIASIIGFAYQLIPLIVLAVVLSVSVVPLLSGSEVGAGIGFLGILGGFLLWGILSFAFSIPGAAALTNYAAVGRFSAGFEFSVIRDLVTDKSYLIAFGYVFVLNIAVGSVIGMIGAIPFVGLVVVLIGPVANFYTLIIAGRLIGRGFVEARGRPQSDASAEAPTV